MSLASRAPAGHNELLLFLDFDGVLMPERVYWHPKRGPYIKDPGEHKLFEHAPLLEQLLAPYPDIKIVLSTSWHCRASPQDRIRLNIRAGMGYTKALKNLPESLRRRAIGGTFHSDMSWERFKDAPRGMQVWSDVLRRKPKDWLALDDDHHDWPAWCRDKLVRTDEEDGIAAPAVRLEIETKLALLVARTADPAA